MRLANEVQRQASMIGYINAFYLLALTAAIAVLEPLLHGVGDVRLRTDPGRASNSGAEIQLTNSRLLLSLPLSKLSADAPDLQLADCIVGHRTVERIAGKITKRGVERTKTGQRVDQLLQLIELRLGCRARIAHNRTERRHDL